MSSLPEHFLFRLEFAAKKLAAMPKKLMPETLGPAWSVPFFEHFRPSFGNRSKSNDEAESAAAFDFRFGWHERGVALTVALSGKSRRPYCDPTKLETSDSFRLILDTRDVRDVHRATRYCHRFLFLPDDAKAGVGAPQAFWLPIHRAKASPNPVDVARIALAAEIKADGWTLSAFLPADLLTGYDPLEHTRIGLWFSLFDNELGWFNLQHPNTFPVEEDPSLWSAVDLAE